MECNRFILNHNWGICFDYREPNCQSHHLAREGIGRSTDMLETKGGTLCRPRTLAYWPGSAGLSSARHESLIYFVKNVGFSYLQ
ncbi:hypothetical protein GQ457_01G010330 [Hibiscus cannabinus]